MLIELTRYNTTPNGTQGTLHIDGVFTCYTCEDPYHGHEKIHGETRIPSGRYQILLRRSGGMNDRYSKSQRIGPHHKGMLHLQNVQDFEWVYIHVGNDESESLGCILVGDTPASADSDDIRVNSSVSSYLRLIDVVNTPLLTGRPVWIQVRDVG